MTKFRAKEKYDEAVRAASGRFVRVLYSKKQGLAHDRAAWDDFDRAVKAAGVVYVSDLGDYNAE